MKKRIRMIQTCNNQQVFIIKTSKHEHTNNNIIKGKKKKNKKKKTYPKTVAKMEELKKKYKHRTSKFVIGSDGQKRPRGKHACLSLLCSVLIEPVCTSVHIIQMYNIHISIQELRKCNEFKMPATNVHFCVDGFDNCCPWKHHHQYSIHHRLHFASCFVNHVCDGKTDRYNNNDFVRVADIMLPGLFTNRKVRFEVVDSNGHCIHMFAFYNRTHETILQDIGPTGHVCICILCISQRLSEISLFVYCTTQNHRLQYGNVLHLKLDKFSRVLVFKKDPAAARIDTGNKNAFQCGCGWHPDGHQVISISSDLMSKWIIDIKARPNAPRMHLRIVSVGKNETKTIQLSHTVIQQPAPALAILNHPTSSACMYIF